jgi:hypothetical protein
MEAIDLTQALAGLPVAAAVAVAVLWTKVHRLEKDRADDSKLVGELREVTSELRATMESVKELVGGLVKISVA